MEGSSYKMSLVCPLRRSHQHHQFSNTTFLSYNLPLTVAYFSRNLFKLITHTAKMSPPLASPDLTRLNTNGLVIDIGGSQLSESLSSMLATRMLNPKQQCVLPSALLSDDNGSALWRQINRLPTYYQTSDEILLLELHGDEISELIEPGTVLLDLGCG